MCGSVRDGETEGGGGREIERAGGKRVHVNELSGGKEGERGGGEKRDGKRVYISELSVA